MTPLDLSRAEWRKSSKSSANGQCVEVAVNLGGIVAVRDSKDPNGPALVFSSDEWGRFVGGVKAGALDGV